MFTADKVQYAANYAALKCHFSFFSFDFAQNIGCRHTLKPPHLGGSTEHPQAMSRNVDYAFYSKTIEYTVTYAALKSHIFLSFSSLLCSKHRFLIHVVRRFYRVPTSNVSKHRLYDLHPKQCCIQQIT